MIRLSLKSLGEVGLDLALAAVAFVMSGVQVIGKAQDEAWEPSGGGDMVIAMFDEQLADDELIQEYVHEWSVTNG